MNLNQFAASINNCFYECFEVAKEVAEAGYWFGDEEIGLDVFRTQRKLIAHLMVADEYLQEAEVNLHRLLYNVPEQSYEEVKDTILYLLDAFPNFFSELPAYLDAVMDFDVDFGTAHTATVVTSFEKLGICVIQCDGGMSHREIERLSYANFLKKIATVRGLEVTLVEDAEIEAEDLQKPQGIAKIIGDAEPDFNRPLA